MTNYSTFADGNVSGSEGGAMARYVIVKMLASPDIAERRRCLSPSLHRLLANPPASDETCLGELGDSMRRLLHHLLQYSMKPRC